MPLYIYTIYKRSDKIIEIEDRLNVINQILKDSDYNVLEGKINELTQNLVINNKSQFISEDLSNRLISSFNNTIEEKFDNQFLQIESLMLIYNSLPNLKLLPSTRGWAGSPDFLAKIAETILKEKPAFIFEASSGVSTIIIGLALKLNNYGQVISLDHEELYSIVTQENIKFNEIEDFAKVKYCPLSLYNNLDQPHLWYQTESLELSDKIDLLIIDGPPRSTQPLARYPAIPLLHQHFADRVLILLDDANRKDEVIIIGKWIEFLENNHYKVNITRFNNFEKGMALLEVWRCENPSF